ncbi:MAG: hypothetical protein IT269_11575 [Saprospiraceae bacterium]|nr:hypothetical protein [Saprospiraceae bacterium]
MVRSVYFFLFFCLAQFLNAQTPCASPQPVLADNCADACIACSLENFEGTINGTAGDGQNFCGSVENDYWLAFIAGATDITIEITVTNCTNNSGIEAAIYPDCTQGPIACSSGNSNAAFNLTATLVVGEKYLLRLDGIQGDVCDFKFNITPNNATIPPALGPTGALQGTSTAIPTTTSVYSIAPVTNAAQYTWTAPAGTTINGQNSPVTLPASTGHTVNITQGFQGGNICVKASNGCETGSTRCVAVTTILTPVPTVCPGSVEAADFCQDACVYCDIDGYQGTTVGYSGDQGGSFCGTIESNSWLGFVARASNFTITALSSNCTDGNGIQMAVYKNCSSSFPIQCNGGANGAAGVPIDVTMSNVTPGERFFLMVDGFAGDQCDFTIEISPSNGTQAAQVGSVGAISGPSVVCPGGEFIYQVQPVSNAGGYFWSGPQGTLINGQASPVFIDSPGGNSVTVTFGPQIGSGNICVVATNYCTNSSPSCKTVDFLPQPITILPPAIVCYEDAPYTLPWGDEAYASGTYSVSLLSNNGCDSIVRQQVTILPLKMTNLGVRYICQGDMFVLNGNVYMQSGNYSEVFESYQGCDSLVMFVLNVSNPIAEIIGNGVITCSTPSVTLTSAPSSGLKMWKRLPSGQVVGAGPSATITQPGMYTLTTSIILGGVSCIEMDTIVITGNITPPDVTINGNGTITCQTPVITLAGSSTTPNAIAIWAGPNGFTANTWTILVNQPGGYTLTVTDPANGCTASETVDIPADSSIPQVMASGSDITCVNTDPVLTASSDVPGVQFQWSGPNGFTSSSATTTATAGPGTYTVVVTDVITGCSAAASVVVELLTDVPDVAINADGGSLSCTVLEVQLHAVSSLSNAQFEWTGPGIIGDPNQPNITANLPGDYTVVVTNPTSGCTNSATYTIAVDYTAPVLSVNSDNQVLNCFTIEVVLSAFSTSPFVSYTWIGPGITSPPNQPTIVVNQPGTYQVIATDVANGCTSSQTVSVLQDIVSPVATATGGILTCANPQINLTSATVGATTFIWDGPNGFTSTDPNPTVSVPGDYTLVAVNSINGCVATITVTVLQDIEAPVIVQQSITSATNNQSNGAIDLDVSFSNGSLNYAWYFNGQLIPNATGPDISGIPGGNYSIVVTADNGCTATQSFIVPNTVGTEDLALKGLWKLTPNPTDGPVMLRFTGESIVDTQLELYDASGKRLQQYPPSAQTAYTLDLGSYPAGYYRIVLRSGKNAWAGWSVIRQ